MFGWAPRSQLAARVSPRANPEVPPQNGEDKFPSPDQKFFYISITASTRGRKRRSLGSKPPRRVWKPQPNCVMADWLGPMEPGRGETFPSGPRRGPAAVGKDKFPSADRKSFHNSTTRTTPGPNRISSGSISLNRVWKPQPHWVMGDWMGLMVPARGERCPPGQRRGPAANGEDNFPSPHQK